jgi:hypothetical protein
MGPSSAADDCREQRELRQGQRGAVQDGGAGGVLLLLPALAGGAGVSSAGAADGIVLAGDG